MDWEMVGSVEQYKTSYDELCGANIRSYKFILTSLQSWHECRDNCRKHKGSYMASFPDEATSKINTAWIMKKMFQDTLNNDNTTSLEPFLDGCYR